MYCTLTDVPALAPYASAPQGGGGSQKTSYSFILGNSLYMTQLLNHPWRISQAHLHSAMLTRFPVIPLFVPSIFRSWKTLLRCLPTETHAARTPAITPHTHANTERHRCKLRRRLHVFATAEPARQTICRAQQLQLRI